MSRYRKGSGGIALTLALSRGERVMIRKEASPEGGGNGRRDRGKVAKVNYPVQGTPGSPKANRTNKAKRMPEGKTERNIGNNTSELLERKLRLTRRI